MSLYEQMRLSAIEKIKHDLLKVSYPQPFCKKNYEYTNCLAYAFGLKQADPGCDYYFPGALSNGIVDLRKEVLIENLISDLYLLGIKCTDITEEEARKRNETGKQIIALFYSESSEKIDFHFIRKDKEGGWSHKPNFFDSPLKVKFNYEKIFHSKFKLIAYLTASLN